MVKDIEFDEKDVDRVTGLPTKDCLEEGIKNRFNEGVLEVITDTKKAHYSVILFDIDYSKAINDLYGHRQDDVVLSGIGRILRKYDEKNPDMVCVLGRSGGEEFLMMLP